MSAPTLNGVALLAVALLAGCNGEPLDAKSIDTLTAACERQGGRPTYVNGIGLTAFKCFDKGEKQ